LLSTQFSNDGSSLWFVFSDSTTMPFGKLLQFPCSYLLRFSGVDKARCIWINETQLVANLGIDGEIFVGDSIWILPGIIKSNCRATLDLCDRYPAISNISSVVLPPTLVLIPSSSLVVPTLSVSCDDLILDGTASSGNGGRRWYSVVWSVTGYLSSANLSLISNYLNNFNQDLSVAIVIPNEMLFMKYRPSSLTFTLELTNFMMQTTATSATVSFRFDIAKGPRLILSGPSIRFMTRNQELLLFANATYPSCVHNVSTKIQYSWTVFQGVNLLDIFSVSSDQRYFKLNPFSLDSMTTYTIQVKVTLNVGTPLAIVVFGRKTVQVGSAGILSRIAGGSFQQINQQNVFYLDGSPSYDQDYPNRQLAACLWTCSMLSPNFGQSCLDGLFPINRLTWEVPISYFIEGTYKFTLEIRNIENFSSTSSVSVALSSSQSLPRVYINSSSQLKYNIGEKVQISATVWSESPSIASWSSPQVDLVLFARTPLQSHIKSTSPFRSVFHLSVETDAFIGFGKYTLLLSVMSISGSVGSAAVDVLMNSPPTGGIFTVLPSSGTALSSQFVLSTSLWTDDPSDYPLHYLFASFSITTDMINVLKNRDEVTYVTSPLSPGLKSQGFIVTCVANATDVYNGEASIMTSVIVFPVSGTYSTTATSQIISLTNNLLDIAEVANNPTAVNHAIAMASTSINSVDCSVPVVCSAIHRRGCSSTPHTCGPCLFGFVGVVGDSNTPCLSASTIRVVGQPCLTNLTCLSGWCYHGMCETVSRLCPSNCNNKGSCLFVDNLGKSVPACAFNDNNCRAQCVCMTGRFGRECALTANQFSEAIQFRNFLCNSLFRALSLQDVSDDVLRARLTTVADLLSDISVVDSSTLLNCSKVIEKTLLTNPSIACTAGSSMTVVTALSNALKSLSYSSQYSTLTLDTVLDSLRNSLSIFSTSCHSTLVAGESPMVFISDIVRISTSLVDWTSGVNGTFLAAASELELALRSPVASMTFVDTVASSLNVDDSFGVTLLQYNNNPDRIDTNSSALIVQAVKYAVNSISNRRSLVANSMVELPFDSVVVVQNHYPIHYNRTGNISVAIYCHKFSIAEYFMSFQCPFDGPLVNVSCPVRAKGMYNITCPSRDLHPECITLDITTGTYFRDPNCQVVAYTESNTSCKCSSSSSWRRLLQDSSTIRSQQISTVTRLYTSPVDAVFRAYDPVLQAEYSQTILIALCSILGIFVFGLLFFAYFDRTDSTLVAIMQKHKHDSARTINGFFQEVLPEEFQYRLDWKDLFLKRLLVEHSWLSLFTSTPNPRKPQMLKSFRWTLCMGRLLTFSSINSLFTYFVFADNGFCSQFQSEVNCAAQHDMFMVVKHSCKWAPNNLSCEFNRPEVTFSNVVLLTLVVTIISLPVVRFMEFLIRSLFQTLQETSKSNSFVLAVNDAIALDQTSSTDLLHNDSTLFDLQPFSWSQSQSLSMNKNFQRLKLSEYSHDELQDIQTIQCKLLLSARLRKFQREVDFVLPSMEAEILIVHCEKVRDATGRSELFVISQCSNFSWVASNFPHNPTAVFSHTSLHSRFITVVPNSAALVDKINRSRAQAESLKHLLQFYTMDREREVFLFQQFIVHLFSGFRKQILRDYLGIHEISFAVNSRAWIWIKTFFLSISLLILVATMIIIVFYYRLSIGSRAVEMWLYVSVVAVLEDIVLIQPFRIYLQWFVVMTFVRDDVRQLWFGLKQRFVHIMLRQQGVMKDVHSLVQHFNPACRISRLFPELAVARFLFALNDFDTPIFANNKDSQLDQSHRQSPIKGPIWQRMILEPLLVIYSISPIFIQDSVLDIIGTLFCNITAIAFFYFGVMVPAAAIVIAILLVVIVLLHELKIFNAIDAKKTLPITFSKVLKMTSTPLRHRYVAPAPLSPLDKADISSTMRFKTQIKPLNTVELYQSLPTEFRSPFSSVKRTPRQILEKEVSHSRSAIFKSPSTLQHNTSERTMFEEKNTGQNVDSVEIMLNSQFPEIDVGVEHNVHNSPRLHEKIANTRIFEVTPTIETGTIDLDLAARQRAAKRSRRRLEQMKQPNNNGRLNLHTQNSTLLGADDLSLSSFDSRPVDTQGLSSLNRERERNIPAVPMLVLGSNDEINNESVEKTKRRRRKERHRHHESDIGGPGIASARKFAQDDENLFFERSSAHSRNLMQYMRLNADGTVPSMDYNIISFNEPVSQLEHDQQKQQQQERQQERHLVDEQRVRRQLDLSTSKNRFPDWH
jgi:hypothetical protein